VGRKKRSVKMKILPVVSGGMDSITMLHALNETDEIVEVISFNYGQRHKVELAYAARNCEKLGLTHKIIDISFLAQLLDKSALTGDIDVPEGHYEQENMIQTVVPNRNMILASIAIGRAVNIGAEAIALGVHSGDHAIYPDCRPEFIVALGQVSEIANYDPIYVLAPFLYDDKTKIIRKGLDLNSPVDYAQTWTCYKGNGGSACGKCGSCQERLEAFKNNDIEDPLPYETRELIQI